MKKRTTAVVVEYEIPDQMSDLEGRVMEQNMTQSIAYFLNQEFSTYYRTIRSFTEQEVRV